MPLILEGLLACTASSDWTELPAAPDDVGIRLGSIEALGDSRVLMWGGIRECDAALGTGAILDVEARTWRSIAPHTARSAFAWTLTDTSLFVWGGASEWGDDVWRGRPDGATDVPGGAVYDPDDDTWTDVAVEGAPTGLRDAQAAWTGDSVVVWGGVDSDGRVVDSGARWDPGTAQWMAMSSVGAPSPRAREALVWTPDGLFVWGGIDFGEAEVTSGFEGQIFADGAMYDPLLDTWTPIPGGPPPLWWEAFPHVDFAVWTGSEVLLVGGVQGPPGGAEEPGGVWAYEPLAATWRKVDLAHDDQFLMSWAWTGDELVTVEVPQSPWWGAVIPGSGSNVQQLHRHGGPTAIRDMAWTGDAMVTWEHTGEGCEPDARAWSWTLEP
jgi:hypothetical protein